MYFIQVDSLGLSSNCIKLIYTFTILFSLLEISLIIFTKKNVKRHLVAMLFVPYILIVLSLTILDRIPFSNYRYNLTLFWSYDDYSPIFWPCGRQVVCNIIMLLPFGFLFPLLIEDTKLHRWKGYTPILALLSSSLIEVVQLVTRRGFFEFDDIVHNTIGAIIGYYIYLLYRWLREN